MSLKNENPQNIAVYFLQYNFVSDFRSRLFTHLQGFSTDERKQRDILNIHTREKWSFSLVNY